MIFRPELAALIREGRKTQTRREVQPGEDCRYEVGSVHPVQPGFGKDAIGRVRMTAVHLQRLGSISFEEARAEGFRTRDEFFSHWRRVHNLGLPGGMRDLLERLADAPAGVTLAPREMHPGVGDLTLKRRLGKLLELGLVSRQPGGRWDITGDGVEMLVDEHEGVDLTQNVWAITFTLVRAGAARPVFLAPASGYTTMASQALTEGRAATGLDEVMYDDVPKGAVPVSIDYSLEVRLARARKLASVRGIEIGDLESAMERRLRAIEARVNAA